MFRMLLAVAVCLLSAAVPASAALPPAEAQAPLTTMDETWPVDTDPNGRLHGVIRNAKTGDPINGACLDVSEYTSGFPPILATVCTGPSGAYEMTLLSTRTYRVNLRADGYQSRWLPDKVNWGEAAVRVPQGGDKQLDGALGEDVGILRGTVTRQDGQPDPFPIISVYRLGAASPFRTIRGDVTGHFSRADIPPGSYQVAFEIVGYPVQWYPAAAGRSNAATVTISAGQTSTIDEQAIALATPPTAIHKPASVSGQVTSGGTPVPHALVKVGSNTAETDAEGRYAISGLLAASYYISVTGPGLPEWWINGRVTPSAKFLSPGGNYLVNLTIPTKYGTLRGVLKDFDGTSLPYHNIQLYTAASGLSVATTSARLDGSFEFRGVPEGNYQLKVSARDRLQARDVTVVDGQTVELVETLIAPTFLAVRIVDVGTGAPVAGSWLVANTQAGAQLGYATTGADGIAIVGPIWDFTAQRVNIYAYPAPTHFRTEGAIETLPAQVNRLTLQAEPGATIRMPVVRKDGVPYTDLLCIYYRSVTFGEEQPGEKHLCGFPDADQVVLLGPLKPGSYRLLVMPAKPLGAQWLAASGGTGIPEEALVFTVATSKITSTPTVRLDPGHPLRARVDDGTNPVPQSCAYIVPNTYFLSACNDSSGLIQVEDLGPYKWPVLFREVSSWKYAATWYGGDGGRMFAEPVQLPMQTGELKMTLRFGGRLSIIDPPWAGEGGGAILRAFDAYTGDYVGGSWNQLDQLDNGRIIIQVQTPTKTCWLTRKVRLLKFGIPYFNTVAGKDVVLAGVTCTQQEPMLLKPVEPGRRLPVTPETTTTTAGLQGKLMGRSTR